MKLIKMLLLSLLTIFSISFVTIGNNFVSADNEWEEKYETHGEHDKFKEKYETDGEYDDGEEGAFGEIGKIVGWGTVMAMGAAGILLPIRKSAKWVIKNVPKFKNIYILINMHTMIGRNDSIAFYCISIILARISS